MVLRTAASISLTVPQAGTPMFVACSAAPRRPGCITVVLSRADRGRGAQRRGGFRGRYLSRRMAAVNVPELTTQEAQVAQMARDGLTNPEIGTRLFISADRPVSPSESVRQTQQ